MLLSLVRPRACLSWLLLASAARDTRSITAVSWVATYCQAAVRASLNDDAASRTSCSTSRRLAGLPVPGIQQPFDRAGPSLRYLIAFAEEVVDLDLFGSDRRTAEK